ncbi:unnamed protein product [Sphagnum balticum]
MSSCSLVYVKANDVRYGLKVASHDPKTSKVLGLQYEFDNDEDADVEDHVFDSEVELNVVMHLLLDYDIHQSTSYLDLHFHVFIKEHSTIVNLHGSVLPMFDRHISKVMFNMVNKFLTMLYLDWTICLIGLASDGARNMTNRIVSIAT